MLHSFFLALVLSCLPMPCFLPNYPYWLARQPPDTVQTAVATWRQQWRHFWFCYCRHSLCPEQCPSPSALPRRPSAFHVIVPPLCAWYLSSNSGGATAACLFVLCACPISPGVAVWRRGADRHVLARRSRVPQGVALYVAGRRRAHPQPQHAAHRARLDGRVQRFLSHNQAKYVAVTC